MRAVVGLAAALGLSACAQDPTAPTYATAAPFPTQRPAPAQGHHDEDADLPPPPPSPTWDTAARAAATAAAAKAMRAFARPQLSAQAWWAELQPLLSPEAAAAYVGTDPAEVPARAVTGAAVLVDQRSTYLAGVAVPTTAGTYRVLLSRRGAGQPWLVERFTPPGGGR